MIFQDKRHEMHGTKLKSFWKFSVIAPTLTNILNSRSMVKRFVTLLLHSYFMNFCVIVVVSFVGGSWTTGAARRKRIKGTARLQSLLLFVLFKTHPSHYLINPLLSVMAIMVTACHVLVEVLNIKKR